MPISIPKPKRAQTIHRIKTPAKQSAGFSSLGPAKKLLLYGSLVLMIASLATPGFINGIDGDWFGIAILLIGLPFAWVALGFAVYANIFYWWAFFRLIKHKPAPVLLLLMWLLAATTPLFSGINYGGGLSVVIAWGWGAVLWFASLTALTLAAVADRYFATKEKAIYILALALSIWIMPAVAIHIYQISIANEEEIEQYHLKSYAFTSLPFSHLPYNPPPKDLPFSEQTTIELIGDINWISWDLNLKTPDRNGRPISIAYYLPGRFLYQGYLIQQNDPVNILTPSLQMPDYILSARLHSDNVMIRLLTDKNQTIVWQAPSNVQINKPYYDNQLMSLFGKSDNFDKTEAILALPERTLITADNSCPMQTATHPFREEKKVMAWEGRLFEFKYIDPDEAYCNNDYALVIDNQTEHNTTAMQIFRRSDMRFLAHVRSENENLPPPSTIRKISINWKHNPKKHQHYAWDDSEIVLFYDDGEKQLEIRSLN